MRGQRQLIEDEGAKVPAYIVTFSDMVTLLLTFFVMLLSLANIQDPELFNMGRNSFWESVRGLGLGLLYGREQKPDFGSVKIKYFVSGPDKFFEDRTIDAKEEEIRRFFKNLSRSMKSTPSQIVAEKTNFSITNIHFGAGDATLNGSAKRYIREFCAPLQQARGTRGVNFYVLGLASDEATRQEQWILSAKRAEVVAGFLQDTLRAGLKEGNSAFNDQLPGWRVYSWGAGPGGDWVGRDSPVSKQSQILIAVLRTENLKTIPFRVVNSRE